MLFGNDALLMLEADCSVDEVDACVGVCDDDEATDACGEDGMLLLVVKLVNSGFCTAPVSFFWLKGGRTGAKIAPFRGIVWGVLPDWFGNDGAEGAVVCVCVLLFVYMLLGFVGMKVRSMLLAMSLPLRIGAPWPCRCTSCCTCKCTWR